MSLYSAFDKNNIFSELGDPLFPAGGGVISGAARRVKAQRNIYGFGVPASLNTAGNITYTAAQILTGCIVRDPNGASRTDILPTAALMAAALPGISIGDIVEFRLINGADAAENITLTMGAGGSLDPNQQAVSALIGQNASKNIYIRFTAVTTPAYVAYV